MTCSWAASSVVEQALMAYQMCSGLWQCVSLRVVEGTSESECPCFSELPAGTMHFFQGVHLYSILQSADFQLYDKTASAGLFTSDLVPACLMHFPTDQSYRRVTTMLCSGTAQHMQVQPDSLDTNSASLLASTRGGGISEELREETQGVAEGIWRLHPLQD